MSLIFSFYAGLDRKGPGSEASTLKALSMLGKLPTRPQIVDFGCGAGAASRVLASAMDCSITAVDIHQPFLDELIVHARREGLGDRIETLQADMANPPLPDNSVDLVWSEGAIYVIGFEQGLKRWRQLLQPGGLLAVTEVTWLTDDPPSKAADFWNAEYPAISSMEENLARVRSAGLEVVGHFTLPSDDWQTYYAPQESRITSFRAEHGHDPQAVAMLDALQQEIDLWKECGDSYGYVFYLARAV